MPANLRADVLSFSLPRISRVVDGGEGYSESQEAIEGGGSDRSLDVQSICESMIRKPAYYKTENQLYLIFSVFITPPTRTHTEVSTKYSSKRRGYTL